MATNPSHIQSIKSHAAKSGCVLYWNKILQMWVLSPRSLSRNRRKHYTVAELSLIHI